MTILPAARTCLNQPKGFGSTRSMIETSHMKKLAAGGSEWFLP
jgi:hypothetical protein